MAIRADAHASFSRAEAVPSGDGTVLAELPVRASSQDPNQLFTARPGPAYVFVDCRASGDWATGGTTPVGVGVGKFTITAAPAAAPVPAVGDRPASATPQLANTGSDAAPMTALAAALVLAGVGAHLLRRRRTTA
ncbi:LPXTG-motif cell wall anchor domain-containing protein [Pedococcus cremeus]|uniref:LPXTG-motif cell wall anchor domain-containing protein n=1 Tax=Pedococcus cremeus TaxID=587636 RepID=A0A1H9WEZ4_9MICO|nr:LPXTG cell wall anchor domain-containing protein [Pedococcus cremeus]SES32405.1 LPXTG-motif cell wall anchor domain-containing protein [Pedococcus cremeus]